MKRPVYLTVYLTYSIIVIMINCVHLLVCIVVTSLLRLHTF